MDLVVVGTADRAGIPRPGCFCRVCLDATTQEWRRLPSAAVLDQVIAIDTPHGSFPGLTRLSATPGDPDLVPSDQWREIDTDQGTYHVRRWFLEDRPSCPLLDVRGPSGRLLWAPQLDLDATTEPPSSRSESIKPPGPVDLAVVGARDPLRTGWALSRLRDLNLTGPQTRVYAIGLGHTADLERFALLHSAWGALCPADGQHLRLPHGPGTAEPAGLPRRTLVIGGTSSGKSGLAEELLAATTRVRYLATSTPAGDDAEWAARIASHQARRPRWWRTIETLDLTHELRTGSGAALIDSLGSWLVGTLEEAGAWEGTHGWEREAQARIDDLTEAWRQVSTPMVAVTDEVGLGLVSPHPSGRIFSTWLGRLNQAIASESEQVLLCTAAQVTTLRAAQ